MFHKSVGLYPKRRLALACAVEAGLVARAKGIDFGWDTDFEQTVEEYVLKFGSTGKFDNRDIALKTCGVYIRHQGPDHTCYRLFWLFGPLSVSED